MNKEFLIRLANANDANHLSQLICKNAKTMLAPHYSNKQWYIFFASPDVIREVICNQLYFARNTTVKLLVPSRWTAILSLIFILV